ncbi:MAG: nitrous oxide reductase accessory protein NosL [Acidimicrobiia bacterium]
MRSWYVVLAVVGLLVGSCTSADVSEGPPEINYGRDICFQCGMIISEARYAAAYRLPDGTEKRFDDLGGLLIHGHESGDLGSAEVWVHDVETEEWLRAEEAFYVMTGDGRTPMAYGIIAFADQARAQVIADGLGAEVLTWAAVAAMSPDHVAHSQHG